MAAIDKMNEFYTCLKRFAFLCECYAPEDIDGEPLLKAFKLIQDYANNPEIMKRIEEAEEYFDDANERIQRRAIAEVLARVLEEVTR